MVLWGSAAEHSETPWQHPLPFLTPILQLSYKTC